MNRRLTNIFSYFSCKRNNKIHTEMDELDKTIYNGNPKKNELYCKDLQEYKDCCTTECCNEHLFWSNSSDKQKE